MHKVLVSDIMTREPVTADPSISLMDISKLMIKKKVGSVLLVRGKKLVGIIAEKDILWAIVKKSERDLAKIKAIEISPKKLATIRPEANLEEVINKMKKYKFTRLPVIKEGVLLGIITSRDILNFHPEIYPELRELEEIREEEQKLKRRSELHKKQGTIKIGRDQDFYNPLEDAE
ncbi:MAG: CBS domain-containing protein [Nanoarchaeota archaeon]|nr:CBS domain-containing protein [Nanoarchaeota archaeon]